MHKNWMQHKNDNNRSLEELWKVSEGYKNSYEPNVEKGLAQLKAKIARDNKATVSTKVVSMNKQWLFRIAAVGMFLITCGFLFNLFVNDSSKLQQLVTTDSLMEKVALSDGSIVWVNKHSTLSFPKTFSKSKRLVYLEGEAFFEVVKDSNYPFIVQTSEGEIKVLGTQFNVRAYLNESSTTVEVKEGSVAFNIPILKEEKVLKTNDKIIFDKEKGTLSKVGLLEWKDIAWKAEQLDFVDQPITEILTYLKENFGVNVEYLTEEFADCPLNATLVNNQPEAILKQIESAFPLIKLNKVHSKQYQLSGNCN